MYTSFKLTGLESPSVLVIEGQFKIVIEVYTR